VWTQDTAVAAAYRVDAQRWAELFEALLDTIEARFGRPEPRRRVRDFIAGLLAPLPVKNCWTIAEHAGDDGPGGMQDLIGRASWDDAEVRADVRAFVAARLGHPDGVLLVDETGDLKKGTHTVGVQRQYSGTAGKIENCQLAVHLSYATPAGHTLLDVALYLPKSWTEDPQRRREAGVPDTVGFATKPQLARRLIETALAGGLPCRWVAGDEAYGGDPRLAAALRQHRLGYVLAVACSHHVRTGLGVFRADRLAADLPKRAWQRLSAGTGAKGFRYYDWAFITPCRTPSTRMQGITGYWSAATAAPANSRSTAAGHPNSLPCTNSSPSPAVAGASRNRFRPPKPAWAWTSISTAAGRRGTAGRPWSSPPTPSSPPPPRSAQQARTG